MLNIDDLFKDSLKYLKSNKTINLSAELHDKARVAFLNMNFYFVDKDEKRKEKLRIFNMSYCKYFVICAAAAQLKGDEKYKDLYLSLAKQLNETDK